MFTSAFVCGIASAIMVFTGRKGADRVAVAAAELAVLFGLIGLHQRTALGPQGLGRVVAMGRAAHVGAGAWLIFVAYLLLRKYGGPGSEKLSAVGRAVRHGQRAVRLLVREPLANGAPEDDGRDDAGAVDAHAVSVVRACFPGVVRAVAGGARAAREPARRSSMRSIWRLRTDVMTSKDRGRAGRFGWRVLLLAATIAVGGAFAASPAAAQPPRRPRKASSRSTAAGRGAAARGAARHWRLCDRVGGRLRVSVVDLAADGTG